MIKRVTFKFYNMSLYEKSNYKVQMLNKFQLSIFKSLNSLVIRHLNIGIYLFIGILNIVSF